jgi:DNA-directed RNA polymerase specialized sigma24 family protein
MPSEGSVTQWIDQLRQGGDDAVRLLWQRYFHRLVGLARTKLRSTHRQVVDEEDVALSAFDSFCRRAEQGKFPDLTDRDGLWRLLVVLTARKAGHLHRDQTRLKRGGPVAPEDWEEAFKEALSREPDPATAAITAEEHRRLMEVLGDDDLRRVAQLRLEGLGIEEIAELVGWSSRSIKRKLHFIREVWENELTR